MRFWFILFFACFAVSAYAQTSTSSSGSTVTATITGVSVNTATRTVSVTVTCTFTNTFGTRGVAWLGLTNSNAIPSQGVADGSQTSPVVKTVNFTYPAGGTVTVYLGTYVFQTSGDNSKFDSKSQAIVYPAGDQPQTVVITPGTASLLA